MTEDNGIPTGSLSREQEKLLNPPMAGVYAQPLHRSGTCDIRVDGGLCPAAGAETNLWRVRWGDGVEMDLCTGCMASLIFEEGEAGGRKRSPEAAAEAIRGMELQFPIEHVIPVVPELLAELTRGLGEFAEMGEELAVLKGSGGNKYSIATDGRYAVLVNAEGYGYPRYRGPRLALSLLAGVTADQADSLCVRKRIWPVAFTIDTAERFSEVVARAYGYAM